MINSVLYPFALLILIFLLYIGFSSSIKYSSKRIKILSLIACITLSLRALSLFVLSLSKSMILIYLSKPLVFLDFIGLSLAAVISVYIILRSDKFKFSYISIFLFITIGFYIVLIILSPYSVQGMLEGYGFSINLKYIEYVYIFYILINTIFLTAACNMLNKDFIDKKGTVLIIIASIVSIVEILSVILGYRLLQEVIFMDIFWMIVFNYSTNKLKNREF